MYPYLNVIQIGLFNGDYLSVERAHSNTKYITTPDKPLQSNIVYLSQHQIRSSSGKQPQETWTYFDKNGKIVSQEVNDFLVYDARKRPWFLLTEQKRRFNWSPVYTFSFSNLPGITASIPLYLPDATQEKLIGVVGIDLSLEEVSLFLKQNKVSQNGDSFILNEDNQLVASSNTSHLVSKDPQSEKIITISDIADEHLKIAQNLFKTESQNTFSFSYNNVNYMASFLNLKNEADNFWTGCIVVPAEDFLTEAKGIRQNILLMILLSITISCIFIFILSKKISTPIVAVANETKKLQELDISSKFELQSNIVEIRDMLTSISSMKNSLASFSKFVPKSLVKKLMQKGTEIKLGGRKKDLTILFTDIENFTNISEGISPEKLVSHLSCYLDELSTILTDNNGTIDKYIGDAIMAFWGAPLADKNQTPNACHAMLLCQKTLGELNRLWEIESKPILRTRMGLHKEEVIVGIIGSQEKMNYTVVGDGANLASRLEGMNKHYGTNLLVSEEVFKAVGDTFLFRPLDVITVKGKKKPIKIYELMAQNKGDPSLLPSSSQKTLSDLFTNAFRVYLLHKWQEALELFKHIEQLYPNDPPTKLYIKRCEEFKLSPPPLDWDGVTNFKTK